jgi:hypothetical protein
MPSVRTLGFSWGSGFASSLGEAMAGATAPAVFFGVPSMNTDLEVEVLWGVGRNDPSEPQGGHREGIAERSEGARPAGRRTGTGYQAGRLRASGPMTAKLSRPRSRFVDPALVQGQPVFLPGEISPHS